MKNTDPPSYEEAVNIPSPPSIAYVCQGRAHTVRYSADIVSMETVRSGQECQACQAEEVQNENEARQNFIKFMEIFISINLFIIFLFVLAWIALALDGYQ